MRGPERFRRERFLAVWPNRDPIGERGGVNPYTITANDMIGGIDALGLLVIWSSISLETANRHYRNGGQEPVRISFELLDTTGVSVERFEKVQAAFSEARRRASGRGQSRCCEPRTFEITDARSAYRPPGSGDAALVLGDVTLKLEGALAVDSACRWRFEGVLKSFDDEYNFDPDWTGRDPIRNVKTVIAGLLAGKGMPYDIQIRGSKAVRQSGVL